MMYRAFLVLVVAVLTTGCHFFETQTGPSADATPATDNAVRSRPGGRDQRLESRAPIVQILDGPNKGVPGDDRHEGGLQVRQPRGRQCERIGVRH